MSRSQAKQQEAAIRKSISDGRNPTAENQKIVRGRIVRTTLTAPYLTIVGPSLLSERLIAETP